MVGVEQKMSQYADDTTLSIAPRDKSLRECMQVLNEFHEILDLQINVEKNKVVKIGVWRDSGTIFCQDLDLLWTNKFTSLGIQFNVLQHGRYYEINIRSTIGDILKIQPKMCFGKITYQPLKI